MIKLPCLCLADSLVPNGFWPLGESNHHGYHQGIIMIRPVVCVISGDILTVRVQTGFVNWSLQHRMQQ